jgi:hypothetical protein
MARSRGRTRRVRSAERLRGANRKDFGPVEVRAREFTRRTRPVGQGPGGTQRIATQSPLSRPSKTSSGDLDGRRRRQGAAGDATARPVRARAARAYSPFWTSGGAMGTTTSAPTTSGRARVGAGGAVDAGRRRRRARPARSCWLVVAEPPDGLLRLSRGARRWPRRHVRAVPRAVPRRSSGAAGAVRDRPDRRGRLAGVPTGLDEDVDLTAILAGVDDVAGGTED